MSIVFEIKGIVTKMSNTILFRFCREVKEREY
jgi:hypothetical protein